VTEFQASSGARPDEAALCSNSLHLDTCEHTVIVPSSHKPRACDTLAAATFLKAFTMLSKVLEYTDTFSFLVKYDMVGVKDF
jgi:hypothetical protein